jgi:hypothetical protein
MDKSEMFWTSVFTEGASTCYALPTARVRFKFIQKLLLSCNVNQLIFFNVLLSSEYKQTIL